MGRKHSVSLLKYSKYTTRQVGGGRKLGELEMEGWRDLKVRKNSGKRERAAVIGVERINKEDLLK